jgi:hypothetical protein
VIANWFANVPFAINFESNRGLDDEEKHTTRESTSSSAAAIAAPGDDMDWVFDVFGGWPITLEKALVADSGGPTALSFRVVR